LSSFKIPEALFGSPVTVVVASEADDRCRSAPVGRRSSGCGSCGRLAQLRNDQAFPCDEEAEQVGLARFKQSEHYQATWARVRDYIDGWKHVNNGR
jgi:hypothetical protein